MEQRLSQAESMLPVHSRMFEKHRANTMREILIDLLFSEMQYHCKVIEELSPILESLGCMSDISEMSDSVIS